MLSINCYTKPVGCTCNKKRGGMNIFSGIKDEDKKALFACLQAVKKTYKKGEIIFDIDDEITSVAYIKSGVVELSKDDYSGSKLIISNLGKGETFAEAIVCSGAGKSSVCATAKEDTEILALNLTKILSVCTNACQFHQRLIANIIKIIALKNLMLGSRIELLSKKTLEERILQLLHEQKSNAKSEFIKIPYSREQMAAYIAADRSALSRQLSKMKQKGIIDYHKNTFRLLQPHK